MSDVNDLASSLFGTSRAEVASGGTSTLYGTAATDSSGGSVSVRMGADTLRADGQAGTSVLVPTTTDVRAGETVIVTVVDGHPVVTGVVGSGDRLRTDVGAAASAASSAQESADSAKASADAATESATTLSRTRMLMATCDTEAATAAKAATLASGSLELRAGASVTVVFSHANTASAPTLDVGGTGARPLRTNGSASAYWADGQAVVLTYDGTYWQVCSTPVYASKVTVGNPGGSNVRIGSNSVDVRDGTDVTASFQRDGVSFLGGKYAVKTYSTALAGSSDPVTGFQVSSPGPAKVSGATSSLVGDIGGITSSVSAGWEQDFGYGVTAIVRKSNTVASAAYLAADKSELHVGDNHVTMTPDGFALSKPLPVSSGGTGATSIDAARRNLHISQGSKVCHGHGTPWVTLFDTWADFQAATGCYASGTPTLVTMNGDWGAFDGTLSGCEICGGKAVYVMAQTTSGLPNISSTQSLRINWICIW